VDQSDEEDVGGSWILEMFDAVFMRKVMLNHGDALTHYFEACFFWIKVAHAEVVVAVWDPRQQFPCPFVLTFLVGLSRHGNIFGIGVSIYPLVI
jgi:hypothetical protein